MADDIDADAIEDIYLEAHEAIREDPSFTPTEKKFTKEQYAAESKKYRQVKLTKEQRQERVAAKIAALASSE